MPHTHTHTLQADYVHHPSNQIDKYATNKLKYFITCKTEKSVVHLRAYGAQPPTLMC